MDTKNECSYCELSHKDPLFWDNHQTMTDGNIWCPKGKTKRVEEMTADIVNRYKLAVKAQYGNKKRHRQ